MNSPLEYTVNLDIVTVMLGSTDRCPAPQESANLAYGCACSTIYYCE